MCYLPLWASGSPRQLLACRRKQVGICIANRSLHRYAARNDIVHGQRCLYTMYIINHLHFPKHQSAGIPVNQARQAMCCSPNPLGQNNAFMRSYETCTIQLSRCDSTDSSRSASITISFNGLICWLTLPCLGQTLDPSNIA